MGNLKWLKIRNRGNNRESNDTGLTVYLLIKKFNFVKKKILL